MALKSPAKAMVAERPAIPSIQPRQPANSVPVKKIFLGISVEIAYHRQEATPPAAGPGQLGTRFRTGFEVSRTWLPESPASGDGGGRCGTQRSRMTVRTAASSRTSRCEGIGPRTFFVDARDSSWDWNSNEPNRPLN